MRWVELLVLAAVMIVISPLIPDRWAARTNVVAALHAEYLGRD